MAESRWRGRGIIRWALTLAVIAYALTDWGSDSETKQAGPSDEADATPSLRITSISDADVTPGDAIVVAYDGAEPNVPIEATVAKRRAEIVVGETSSVVVRIPSETPYGKAGLRLVQGTHRSKAWDLHVRASNHRKLIGRLLGGLAFFVYGLGLLALGVRGLAGQGVRTLLGRLTRNPPQAVGVGVLVGSVTQLTSSSAAFAVSLVDARMLALAPTIAILVGAQLGASITGALLPVGFARESLLVIAIGVLWTRLSTSRRANAVAQLILGAGLMLYGLHLLQTSVEPLVGDPKILPYVGYLRAEGVTAMLTCAAIGALLAFVLQGPGPVYVLVVGLAQASGTLPLTNALAILAGTNLGAALGMALIAWQSGRLTRRLATPHILFGMFATALALATLPLWKAAAEAIMGTDPGMREYGHSVVQHSMSARLAVGFAISQISVVGAWLLVLPALIRRATHTHPTNTAAPELSNGAIMISVQTSLARVLEGQRKALDAALETSCSGDRARAAECEEELVESRLALQLQITMVSAASSNAEIDRMARTLVASLQLQRVVEQLIDVAELGVERGLRLSTDEQARLRTMHELARESFDILIAALEGGGAPDPEAAGGREIRMNVLEAEGRTESTTARRKNESASVRFGVAELIGSYEHVGNHLFRVTKAMTEDSDELG
jgi:Na+/phosphate symporter